MIRAITSWWKQKRWTNNTSCLSLNTHTDTVKNVLKHPTCGCKCSSGIKRMDKLADTYDIS